jgi:hypothetical protein
MSLTSNKIPVVIKTIPKRMYKKDKSFAPHMPRLVSGREEQRVGQ